MTSPPKDDISCGVTQSDYAPVRLIPTVPSADRPNAAGALRANLRSTYTCVGSQLDQLSLSGHRQPSPGVPKPPTGDNPGGARRDKRLMHHLGAGLISSCVQLLWPAHCAGCETLLQSDSAVFCGECAQTINPFGLACAGCGLPRFGAPGVAAPVRCPGCDRRDFAFSQAHAGFEYGAAIAAAIVRMKHGGRPDLARRLGRILQDAVARALGGEDSPRIDAVLPVPLHPRKLRRRGFNQSLELARVALARIRARSCVRPVGAPGDDLRAVIVPVPVPTLERHLLVRTRHTRELGHSGPGARRVEVFGAFGVADPARTAGRRFLVLDDVMTTGATLNECAETLLRAGAAEVRVVALARAM